MALWGGRFEKEMEPIMRRFNDSFAFDYRLYAADIDGSLAYASALSRAGLITEEELDLLCEGLEQVRAEFDDGSFEARPGDEDIHTAVERRLVELVGEAAEKIHTGRSRNDQVATDLRLYLLEEISSLSELLGALQAALAEQAETHLDVYMPGYTHLQQAQPILFSHWVMAYFWKFQRDYERLTEVTSRTNVCPLGAGALAGNPFEIDRMALAETLNFDSISENSLDAVSDRDFVVEFMSWAVLTQIHLSGWAEELIIWASSEFGFLEIDDAYATGSSLMPQKKNPDSLELIRGKSGRVVGHLVGLLTTLKGLPLAYNKDLQEDKEALFDVIDTLKIELPIATGIICTMKINAKRMAAMLNEEMLATDLADYLVREGVPFRKSHHLVGQAVLRAEELGVPLTELDLSEYQAIHTSFTESLYGILDMQESVKARAVEGGTAPQAVRNQIKTAKDIIKHL